MTHEARSETKAQQSQRTASTPGAPVAAAGAQWSGAAAAGASTAPLWRADPPTRARLALEVQRRHGNAHLQRLLAKRPPAVGWLDRCGAHDHDETAAPVARQPALQRPLTLTAPHLTPPRLDAAIAQRAAASPDEDLAGLRLQGQLAGAGFTPQPAAAMSAVLQREPPAAAAVTATVNLTVNQPTVSVRPGAEIGTAHGRPGAVGWTTPSYNIQVPFGNSTAVTINVTLDFLIELPSDYDEARQAVVSDHEIGHLRIGERKAKEHLVDGLKRRLEATTGGLTRSAAQTAIQQAAQGFVEAERTGSQAYDDADYPRMVEAYRGVRASLAALAARSPAIARLVRVLRRLPTALYSSVRSYDEAGVEGTASDVAAAAGALSNQERWRLQYNREFQARLGTARSSLASYLNGAALLGVGLEELPASMRPHLVAIQNSLAGFTFSPSAAAAAF